MAQAMKRHTMPGLSIQPRLKVNSTRISLQKSMLLKADLSNDQFSKKYIFYDPLMKWIAIDIS